MSEVGWLALSRCVRRVVVGAASAGLLVSGLAFSTAEARSASVWAPSVAAPTLVSPTLDLPVAGPVAMAQPVVLDAPVVPPVPTGDVVVSPTAEGTAAPGLPVTLATADSATSRSVAPSVRVRLVDQATADRLGVSLYVVQLSRADGVAGGASVEVDLDYSAWAEKFGGEFVDRLRLVEVPVCALAAKPAASCPASERRVIAAERDRQSGSLRATIEVTSSGVVADDQPLSVIGSAASQTSAAKTAPSTSEPMALALSSTSTGDSGNFAATPLSASGKWEVSANTGEFNWSYDVETPPGFAGEAPGVSVRYSSGSVDGMTPQSNNQPGWAGLGWDVDVCLSLPRRSGWK